MSKSPDSRKGARAQAQLILTSSDEPTTPQLAVDRNELVERLKSLARHFRRTAAGEAGLRFDGNELEVEIGGSAITASATGSWAGEARTDGKFVLALARSAPDLDPLPIWVVGEMLHVASLSMSCRWQAVGAGQISLPIKPTLAETLRHALDHSNSTVEQSGIHKPVELARERRRKLVDQASLLLKPLDVRREDIERMVDECLRRDVR